MDLNRLAIQARLRTPWESMDLGVLLARRHWWPMFVVWLLPAAAVFLLSALLLWEYPTLSIILVWWLKPMYDRLPLYIASRALFSTSVRIPAALGQFLQSNRKDWLAWLSWRRLSMTRSFDMPITLLEGSSGATRNARLAVLHRKSAGAASWLTLVCVHVEMILMFGLSALVYLMLPEQLDIDWFPLFNQDSLGLEWAINGLSVVVMAAAAPFYICSGFLLYIGRRVELEAWDIEISFRKLQQRLTEAAQKRRDRGRAPGTALLLAFSLAALSSGLAPLTTTQAHAEAQIQSPGQAQVLIDETLAGDDFHQREIDSGWKLKEFDADQSIPEWLIALMEWLESRAPDTQESDTGSLGPLLASLLEILLWIAVVAIVGYLLWRYREQIGNSFGKKTRDAKPLPVVPQTLFGLDVRKKSLPEDVCSEVLRLWYAGSQRASLGLLYGATLAHLIEHFHFQFRDHHTEQECAQLVRSQCSVQPDSGSFAETAAAVPAMSAMPAIPAVTPALEQLVSQVTASWQQLAYAHQSPDTPTLEKLCAQWREVFAHEG